MAASLTLGLAGAASANAAVTITSPANGAYTNDTAPEVHVAGVTPGDSITLEVNGTAVDTVAATDDGNGNGIATLTPDKPLNGPELGIGANSPVTLTANDNDTGESAQVGVNFDTVPLLSGNGNTVDIGQDQPIYLTGGIPNEAANFYFDGQLVASPNTDASGAATDANGDFLNLTPGNLTVGHHSAYAKTVDANDVESGRSETFTFDVRPASPQFTALPDASHLNTGELDIAVDGIDPDAEAVDVYDTDSDGNTVVVGTSTDIAADGTATVSVNLADGQHYLEVAQTVNDVESERSSVGSNGITIKSAAPTLGSIDTPISNATPEFEVSNLLGNNVGNNNRVRLYIDGQLVATGDIGGDDSTYVAPDEGLTEGDHTAYVTSVDDFDHEGSQSNTVRFTVDTVAPIVTFTAPTDGSTVKTATPTFTLHTEPGAEVHLWLGDGTDVTLTADADGNASYTAQQALRDGEGTYGAYAIDAAGNQGAEVDGTLVIDTSTPDNGGDQGTTPTTPTTPTQPAAPAVPVAPTTPTQPITSTQPTTPAKPATPAAPAKVSLSSHTLTASKPVKVRFTLAKAGTVKVTITKVVKGKTIVVATVTVHAKAGKGSYTLKTKVGKKKLGKGRYKVSVQSVHGKKTSKKVSQAVSVK